MSRPKLLLADDSLTIQKLINLTFADEGFDVTTVGDGDSALREIAQVQPDIVLADVHMPGPSGYEICSLIRGMDETSELPVILLVGSFEPFDPEEADRVGANTHLTKPFPSIRQVVDQVRSLLAGEPAVAPYEADAGSEFSGESAVQDTNDIDSLYEQSFAETVEMPAEMAAAIYSGSNLDDPLVESSYDDSHSEDTVEFSMATDQDNDFDDIVVTDPENMEPVAANVVSLDDDYQEPVYDDLPATDGSLASSVAALQSAPTEEFRHEAGDPFASTADEFDLDEIDLLGLTPSEAAQQYSFTAPADAKEKEIGSQVVSLSPELIDMIAQKVVEKLSEKY